MFLPKLSNQKIGCYYCKSPATQTDVGHPGLGSIDYRSTQVDDIGHELAKLKIEHDHLNQMLRQVGEQFLTLAQNSGGPVRMSG